MQVPRWRNAADAFGRRRNAGYRSTVEETCPRGSDCGPVRKRRMSHRLPTGYSPPVDSAEVVRTRVRQTARPALEHVGVMQEPVEQRGDRGGVAEELSHSSTGRLEVSIVEARS